MPLSDKFIPTSQLMHVAFGAMLDAHTFIRKTTSANPKYYFAKIRMRPGAHDAKDALLIDRMAEETCRTYFEERLGRNVNVIGEESSGFGSKDATVSALVDIVDGTDLLAMQIPLWCSAIVLSDRSHKIVGSIVGQATGEIYMASENEAHATVVAPSSDAADAHLAHYVSGPSRTKSLREARVAYYGQKPKNFLSLIRDSPPDPEPTPSFSRFVRSLEGMNREDPFRVYNFAGNPIMMKLVDRLKDEDGTVMADGIDAVFDVSGQLLHDVVPGVYIAVKAGAYLCDLAKKPITLDDLGHLLAVPSQRLKYVLACTRELAEELCDVLQRPEAAASAG